MDDSFCSSWLKLKVKKMPHLAPTYSAVVALLEIGTEEAYQSVDRYQTADFQNALSPSQEETVQFLDAVQRFEWWICHA